ncbi:hypothetical protein BC629DRAFT_264966 [Irpex lacteus]|nr:hypothetical protein BC629DRAFT_264966 [Irpex lacteus]
MLAPAVAGTLAVVLAHGYSCGYRVVQVLFPGTVLNVSHVALSSNCLEYVATVNPEFDNTVTITVNLETLSYRRTHESQTEYLPWIAKPTIPASETLTVPLVMSSLKYNPPQLSVISLTWLLRVERDSVNVILAAYHALPLETFPPGVSTASVGKLSPKTILPSQTFHIPHPQTSLITFQET